LQTDAASANVRNGVLIRRTKEDASLVHLLFTQEIAPVKYFMRFGVLAASLVLFGVRVQAARSDELPVEYRATVSKGLEWLVKMQQRDGHWEGHGGQYQGAMTALCGMAFLMEGSTLHDGKYAANLRKAVDWMMDHGQNNGLLGNAHRANERERYMYGHGFGLLFLASVYGEEEDSDRRKRLEGILNRGVQFTGKAQTSRGGWGYVANGCNTEGDDLDEGSVTITQVQALRAARNAGISVPGIIIDKAITYLKKSTGPNGGVIYSLGMGRRDERAALTAAAVACGFSLGEYQSPLVKGWIKSCQNTIRPLGVGSGRIGHDEYTHYYYAQVLYMLGEDGYAKLFPNSGQHDRLSWSKYRKTTFDSLAKLQSEEGSWNSSATWGYVGPIYTTALSLSILQLDKATLPIYQR
jgi:hypothetical protein